MVRPARFLSLSALFGAALLLLTSFFAFLPAASAMEAVDFHQAVARALSNNAFVSAAGEEAVAARRDADAARGYLLPSVRFDEKFVRTNVPAEAFGFRMNQEKLLSSDFLDVRNFNSPPPRNDFIGTLSLEQPLFAPKAYIGYGMAKVEADAKDQDLYRRKEDAVYRVLASVLDVVTARQFAEVAGQGLSDAREHLRIAGSLEAAGMGLASDVLRAKVAVASAESAKVTAESRLELARRRSSETALPDRIDELAACPNVVVKIGGILMAVNGWGLEDREKPPTSAEAAAREETARRGRRPCGAG